MRRHSTITLTMDTYGHRLADQHADAIGGTIKWGLPDSNREPSDYESPALTVELRPRIKKLPHPKQPMAIFVLVETAGKAHMLRRGPS